MPSGHCLNILLFWQRSTAALVFRVAPVRSLWRLFKHDPRKRTHVCFGKTSLAPSDELKHKCNIYGGVQESHNFDLATPRKPHLSVQVMEKTKQSLHLFVQVVEKTKPASFRTSHAGDGIGRGGWRTPRLLVHSRSINFFRSKFHSKTPNSVFWSLSLVNFNKAKATNNILTDSTSVKGAFMFEILF